MDADRANDSVPPGWERNPSRWSHRAPLAALAFVGFCVATYLTLYQSRAVGSVWEPFFGAGSRTILNSGVARFLPVPDASLGAAAYLAEVVLCLAGGPDRWRRWPWVVVFYGLVVAGLGAGSVGLVIFQGDVYHAWCTLCLVSALISVNLVGPGLTEPLASLQYFRRELRTAPSGSSAPGTGQRSPAGRA